MIGILTALLPIGSQLARAWEARQRAQTDAEKIAADERIAFLKAKQAVQVAEAGSKINALVRLLFAVPPALYLAKLYVWDKVLGLGTTDPLSPLMESVLFTVVGFYFLTDGAERVARIVRR